MAQPGRMRRADQIKPLVVIFDVVWPVNVQQQPHAGVGRNEPWRIEVHVHVVDLIGLIYTICIKPTEGIISVDTVPEREILRPFLVFVFARVTNSGQQGIVNTGVVEVDVGIPGAWDRVDNVS